MKKKKNNFKVFCQPIRLIICANDGNHVRCRAYLVQTKQVTAKAEQEQGRCRAHLLNEIIEHESHEEALADALLFQIGL